MDQTPSLSPDLVTVTIVSPTFVSPNGVAVAIASQGGAATAKSSFKGQRPRSNHAQMMSAIFAGVTASCAIVAAIAAFIGVYKYFLSMETAKLQNAEQSIARLYPLDIGANQGLGQFSNARAALYNDPDGTIYAGLNKLELSMFKDACSRVGSEFEYYVLIRDHIKCHPKGPDIVQSWNEYEKTICQKSLGFRVYINSERQIWTHMFLQDFDDYTKGLRMCICGGKNSGRQHPPLNQEL